MAAAAAAAAVAGPIKRCERILRSTSLFAVSSDSISECVAVAKASSAAMATGLPGSERPGSGCSFCVPTGVSAAGESCAWSLRQLQRWHRCGIRAARQCYMVRLEGGYAHTVRPDCNIHLHDIKMCTSEDTYIACL
eukprot:360719-Chlamydomonas_euryale.AAC.21